MDEVFNFEELLFRLLRKWRFILSTAIIFAVIAGGYTAYSGIRSVRASITITTEEDLERLRHIEPAESYLEKSIMMKINPYNIQTTAVAFLVRMQDEESDRLHEDERILAGLYKTLISDNKLYENISAAIDSEIAPDYLRELIYVQNPFVGQNPFVVIIIGDDSDLTEQIAEALISYYLNRQGDLSKLAGAHSLEVVDKSSYSIIDLQHESWQTSIKNSVNRLKPNAIDNSTRNMGSVIRSAALYSAMGGVGGIGVSILFILFFDSINIAVRSDKELRKKYSLRFLGSVPKR